MRYSDYQGAILAYVCEHPGVTTNQVAAGCDLSYVITNRNLVSLHSKKLLGRQHSLYGMLPALWFPEANALRAHREVKT